jgi:hypothetical protein
VDLDLQTRYGLFSVNLYHPRTGCQWRKNTQKRTFGFYFLGNKQIYNNLFGLPEQAPFFSALPAGSGFRGGRAREDDALGTIGA